MGRSVSLCELNACNANELTPVRTRQSWHGVRSLADVLAKVGYFGQGREYLGCRDIARNMAHCRRSNHISHAAVENLTPQDKLGSYEARNVSGSLITFS